MQSHSAQARTRRIVIHSSRRLPGSGGLGSKEQGAKEQRSKEQGLFGAWLHGCMPPEFPLIPSNPVTGGELSTGSITYHRAGF